MRCSIYVGKVGTLTGEHVPNECIATGNEVYMGGKSSLISWKSPLQSSLRDVPGVATGKLVTALSPLAETHAWLQKWQDTATWVDCETGHMAAAAKEADIEFGYLHIISDNLASKYKDDLSNKDFGTITTKTDRLYQKIEGILETFFSSRAPNI